MVFSKDYNQSLKRKWDTYIAGDLPMPAKDPEIRDFIYASWKRSKEHNVSPLEVKNKLLSEQELDIVLKSNKKLIDTAHPYLQSIYSFIKGTNFLLALTDNRGYVIDLLGDDTMIRSRTNESGLTIGCCRSEEYAGTNGIGTCLMVGNPIQIWGCEHYIKPHRNYVCSAAPIRDANNNIIGCLDVVGPVTLPHNHTLAMVSAAADGIQKELAMQEAYENIAFINSQMASTIEAIDSGIVMFDNQGTISQYNNRAWQLLNVPESQFKKENISSIIDVSTSSIDLLHASRNIQNRVVSLTTCTGEQITISLSLSIVTDSDGQKRSTVLVFNELKKLHKLVNQLSGFTAKYTFDSILGQSPAIQSTLELAKAASQSSSNVLILGESGTGKELLAQAIHNASPRAAGPFIAINCGSLPTGLIESELFGYERGAFTGANREGSPGKFELANGGTIFLDEIGDMPLELQASLLRVLQSKEIIRIGGKQSKFIDVRIMAATNVNLLESVQNKAFRGDLYYRLNVLSIEIPALRNRRTDIPLLTDHFITSISRTLKKNITYVEPDAMQVLNRYNWPGNIRELENTIERAVNMARGNSITLSELPPAIVHEVMQETPQVSAAFPAQIPDAPHTDSFAPASQIPAVSPQSPRGHQLIIQALTAAKGNVSKAAEYLGISRRTMYRKIEKYQINPDDFRII